MTKSSLTEKSSHIGNIDIRLDQLMHSMSSTLNLLFRMEMSEGGQSSDESQESPPEEVNVLCYYQLLPKSASSDILSLSLEGNDTAQSSHYMICLLASADALLDLYLFCVNSSPLNTCEYFILNKA
jgi:hypothetical protein